MSTKEELLALLEKEKGSYLSGENIARLLSVSRTAVWKAVKSLREEGYQIDAVQNRGYCLAENTDILSLPGMQKYLKPVCRDLRLEIVEHVSSTNEEVRAKAAAGEPEGYVLVALRQTKGKGRIGRPFFSPAQTGIYMSLLLRPRRYTIRQAAGLTAMAAAACCDAIEKAAGEEARIKWVNDVFVRGKKVSGILTEASLGLEEGSMDFVVLGIGINAYTPEEGFPSELADTAGAVFAKAVPDGKNRLAAEFLNSFMTYYTSRDPAAYVKTYRERNFVPGREIEVIRGEKVKKALALDVDEECRLLVRYEDGKEQRLSAGEIRIKL